MEDFPENYFETKLYLHKGEELESGKCEKFYMFSITYEDKNNFIIKATDEEEIYILHLKYSDYINTVERDFSRICNSFKLFFEKLKSSLEKNKVVITKTPNYSLKVIFYFKKKSLPFELYPKDYIPSVVTEPLKISDREYKADLIKYDKNFEDYGDRFIIKCIVENIGTTTWERGETSLICLPEYSSLICNEYKFEDDVIPNEQVSIELEYLKNEKYNLNPPYFTFLYLQVKGVIFDPSLVLDFNDIFNEKNNEKPDFKHKSDIKRKKEKKEKKIVEKINKITGTKEDKNKNKNNIIIEDKSNIIFEDKKQQKNKIIEKEEEIRKQNDYEKKLDILELKGKKEKDMEEEIKTIKNDNIKLKNELEKQNNDNMNLMKELKKQKSDNMNLKKELEKQKSDNMNLKKELEKQKKDNINSINYKEETEKYKKKVNKINEENKQLTMELKKVNEDKRILKEKEKEMKEKENELKEQIKNLKIKIKELEENIKIDKIKTKNLEKQNINADALSIEKLNEIKKKCQEEMNKKYTNIINEKIKEMQKSILYNIQQENQQILDSAIKQIENLKSSKKEISNNVKNNKSEKEKEDNKIKEELKYNENEENENSEIDEGIGNEEKIYSYELITDNPEELQKNVVEFEQEEISFEIKIKNNGNISWPGNGKTKLIMDNDAEVKINDIELDDLQEGQVQNIKINLNLENVESGLKKYIFNFNVGGKNYGNPIVFNLNVEENEKVKEFREMFSLPKEDYSDTLLYEKLEETDFNIEEAFNSLF